MAEKRPANRQQNRVLPPVEYRFKPGQSGNPSGRPKKKWLTEAFEELLERNLSDPKEREAFMAAQWKKLLSHTVVSTMLLEKMLERTEGKLTQPVEHSGEVAL